MHARLLMALLVAGQHEAVTDICEAVYFGLQLQADRRWYLLSPKLDIATLEWFSVFAAWLVDTCLVGPGARLCETRSCQAVLKQVGRCDRTSGSLLHRRISCMEASDKSD